jgi:hypothetical protein
LSGATLRLRIEDQVQDGELVTELTRRVNSPRWPTVEVTTAGTTISCRSQTWEPLLRVRLEDAFEDWLGHLWRDSVQFL